MVRENPWMAEMEEFQGANLNGPPLEMTRDLGKRAMDLVAKDINEELGVDKGVVILTRKVADLIAWNPETVDARKQFVNYEETLLQGDKTASVAPIGRTMSRGGPTFASFLSTEGMDGMLGKIEKWTHSRFWLQLTYGGMSGLMKNLQIIDDCVKGNDEHSNVAERRKAINKLIQEMMAHKEFPPVDDRTAERWQQMPLAGGKGTIKAGEYNWTPTLKEAVDDSVLGDFFSLFKKK